MKLTKTILPYLKKYIGKNHFERGDFVSDELYVDIAEKFIKYFEDNKEVFINNIYNVYKLTDGETGYNALAKDWDKWRDLKSNKKERFSKKDVEEFIKERMSFPLLHLYQADKYGEEERERTFSFVGLLIVASISVEISQSEKRNKEDVILDMGINLSIGANLHEEIEIYSKD